MLNEKTKYFVICAVIVLATSAAFYWRVMWFSMPGQTHEGALHPLFEEEQTIKSGLDKHVDYLVNKIGERNFQKYDRLQKCADYISLEFSKIGYEPRLHEFDLQGKRYRNIEVVVPGAHPELGAIIFGAHYDSPVGSVGADDNASGVAALLTLAEMFKCGLKMDRTLKFVAFANGNTSANGLEASGASRYLSRPETANEVIKGFVSLDGVGNYSDEIGSEKLPDSIASYYPAEGNFLMFVADARSAQFCRDLIQTFRVKDNFPSEGIICQNRQVPVGIAGTDQIAFWNARIPAVLLTDTSSCRVPASGAKSDDLSCVDTSRLARVVSDLRIVLDGLGSR